MCEELVWRAAGIINAMKDDVSDFRVPVYFNIGIRSVYLLITWLTTLSVKKLYNLVNDFIG